MYQVDVVLQNQSPNLACGLSHAERRRDLKWREDVLRARAVISAVGQLNRPSLPDIPGRDDFAGPSFHSARWDHSVDVRGKRVALVGAGASGFQIAPTIAPDVAQLTVFQRTAQWMFPNPNYHEKVGPGVQWAIRHLPFYGRWYRFLLFWPGCDGGLVAARVDPEWKKDAVPRDPVWHPGETISVSIGQGALEVTPFQMAVFASTIATNGAFRTY